MNLAKRKIEELISAAEKIIEAQDDEKKRVLFDLGNNDETLKGLSELLDPDVLQNPDKSYNLFYDGIQRLLLTTVPKDLTIRDVIFELKTILLTGKEKEFITYGKRGADSRMSETSKMDSVIDILTEWSETPTDYLKLAHLLLNRNKELLYVPEERTIADYVKR